MTCLARYANQNVTFRPGVGLRNRARRYAAAVVLLCALAIIVAALAIPSNAAPVITSVSSITTQQFQTITILGSGFGTHGPYTGDSPYISFSDFNRVWQAGYTGYYWGYYVYDAIYLIVGSWNDTKIVLDGFSGSWGWGNWTLANGDLIGIDVWNPQSGQGPASFNTAVGKPVPEPQSLALLSPGLALVATLRLRRRH